jgi:hypothetical protein
MASALTQSSADAHRDIEWCAEDPVFTVLGATFRITTSVNSPASAVTRIVYVVEVPQNAGHVTVIIPPGEVLASVTEVQIKKTGEAYEAGQDSFEVRVSITVSGPDQAKVLAQLDGPSVEFDTFKGKTGKPLTFKFDVTP